MTDLQEETIMEKANRSSPLKKGLDILSIVFVVYPFAFFVLAGIIAQNPTLSKIASVLLVVDILPFLFGVIWLGVRHRKSHVFKPTMKNAYNLLLLAFSIKLLNLFFK